MKIEPKDFRIDFNIQKVDYDASDKTISVWVRSPVRGYAFNTTRMDNQVCFTWNVSFLGEIEKFKDDIIWLLEYSIDCDLHADDNPNYAITRKPWKK